MPDILTPVGGIQPADLKVGDLVQGVRDRMLGHVFDMQEGYVTFQWVDRRRQITQHPSPVPQVDALWIGRIDATTTRILLEQLSLDMLDVGSASLLLREINYAHEETCDALADALMTWTRKTLTERRRGVVMPSWRSIMIGAASRIASMHPASASSVRVRTLADLMVHDWNDDGDPAADEIMAMFERNHLSNVHLDLQQIAYAVGRTDLAIAQSISDLCLRGRLVRIDDRRPVYGLSEKGRPIPNIMIDAPIPWA